MIVGLRSRRPCGHGHPPHSALAVVHRLCAALRVDVAPLRWSTSLFHSSAPPSAHMVIARSQ